MDILDEQNKPLKMIKHKMVVDIIAGIYVRCNYAPQAWWLLLMTIDYCHIKTIVNLCAKTIGFDDTHDEDKNNKIKQLSKITLSPKNHICYYMSEYNNWLSRCAIPLVLMCYHSLIKYGHVGWTKSATEDDKTQNECWHSSRNLCNYAPQAFVFSFKPIIS